MTPEYTNTLDGIAMDIAGALLSTLAVAAGRDGAIGVEEALHFLDEADETMQRRANDSNAWREFARQIMLHLATHATVDYRPQDALYVAIEVDRILRVCEAE